jgi:hypothetical protein
LQSVRGLELCEPEFLGTPSGAGSNAKLKLAQLPHQAFLGE